MAVFFQGYFLRHIYLALHVQFLAQLFVHLSFMTLVGGKEIRGIIDGNFVTGDLYFLGYSAVIN